MASTDTNDSTGNAVSNSELTGMAVLAAMAILPVIAVLILKVY